MAAHGQSRRYAERLKRALWTSWPEREQAALRSVFRAGWAWAVEQSPETGSNASDWLCGIAALEEQVLPVLLDWGARPSINALRQAAWLGLTIRNLISNALDDLAYWTYVKPEVRRSIVEWGTSRERIDALQAGLDAVGEDDRWYVEKALNIAQEVGRQ